MNWTPIITLAVFVVITYGAAKLYERMGWGKEDRELLEEYNKKRKKIK